MLCTFILSQRTSGGKKSQNWGLEVFECQQQHVSCRTDILSRGFIIGKAAGCLSVSSVHFCCLGNTCNLRKHTRTHTHRASDPYTLKPLHHCTWGHLYFVVALLSCCWHTRKHTHSQMITRCWHPHSAPLPLHQLLLPQQQVSSRPPPPAFCQRWTTGAFQPWTQTKQTHTCWVIRSAVAMVAEFLKLHVDVFICLPVCWHNHKLHWIVLQNEKMWLLLERILSELRFRSSV